MADYDAGTARAHIKVDGDSRGADNATRSVEGFQRALEFIASHLGGFVAAMDKIEGELNSVQGDFKDAASAADRYDAAISKATLGNVKASKSTRDFARNIDDLHGKLKFAHDAWADYALPIIQANKAMQEFKKQGGGVSGVIAGISRAGIASTAINTLKNHFIGLGGALRQAPAWQQSIAKVAQNIGLFTLAGSKVGVVATVLTKSFSNIVRGAEGADFAMAGLAHTLSKIPVIKNFADPLVKGFGKILDGAEGAEFAIAGFESSIRRATTPVANFFRTLDDLPAGMFKVVGGMALMSSGMRGLQTRFAALNTLLGSGGGGFGTALRFILLPGIILSAAATQVFDKTLIALSNTLAGLWSGIKQLSGGFAALPGLIATVGAAAVPLIAIVKTIKSNFKDLISAVNANDPEKFAQAMAKIPPYLRPLGQAVANAIGPLKSLGDVLTATFVSNGLADQFSALVNTWLPAISTGADEVANSWKILTNHVLEFLGQAQTVTAVNTIFMHTSQTMNAIGDAIKPVLSGLRDLAVVGSTFIRNLAEDYLPGISQKFGDWATNAAATGKAMGWMEGSVRAIKNLYTGFDQLIRLTWTLLTLFQTKPGDTFLGRFAAEMTKLNNQVKTSAVSGELRKIADSVKSVGTDKIKELLALFKDIWPAIKAIVQTLGDMGNAFGQILLPVIKDVTAVVVPLVKAFNDLGGGAILGTILGITKAFGLLKVALGTGLDFAKIFIGFRYVTNGVQNVLVGLQGTLEKFGPIGQRASDGISRFGDSIANFIGKAALMATVVLVAFSAFDEATKKSNQFQDTLKEGTKIISDFHDKLNSAFVSDKGLVGNNVLTAIDSQVAATMSNLKSQASQMPGILDHIIGFFDFTKDHDEKTSWNPLEGIGDPKWINQAQASATAAKGAQDAMDKLGLSTSQVSTIIAGSDSDFQAFISNLKSSGDGGQLLADKMQTMRDQFTQMQTDMKNLGPSGVALAAAIQKIAGAAGDTETKLDGMKSALEALGILQTNQYEAAVNYAKAVEGLGDAAEKAADKSQTFGDILDANGQHINAWSHNGINLINVLQPLGEAFLHAAAAGQDPNALWNDPRLQSQMQAVANSFQLPLAKIQELIQQFGVSPKPLSLLVQLDGSDKTKQDLILMMSQLENTAQTGVEIPIKVSDPTKISQLINTALGGVYSRADQNVLYIEPNLDTAALSKLNGVLSQNGIQVPGAPPPDPTTAPQMPVNPVLGSGTTGGPKNLQDLLLGSQQAANAPAPITAPVPRPPGPPVPPPLIPAPGEQPAPPKSESKAPAGPPPSGYQLPVGMPPNSGYVPPAGKATPAGPPIPLGLPPGTYYPPGMTVPGQAPPITPNPPVPVGTPAPPLPALSNILTPAGAGQGQGVNIPVQITGIDQFNKLQDQFKALGASLAKNIGEWQAWNAGILASLGVVQTSFQTTLAGIVQEANDFGKKFTEQLAAGIQDPASLKKVTDAAVAVVNAAKAVTNQNSPAKKGPLSGSGWSGAQGERYSDQFAQGILGGSAGVGDAAGKVAGKARGALTPKTPYGTFGFTAKDPGLGRINSVLKAAADGISLVKSVTDQMSKATKLFLPKETAGANKATTVGNILNQGVGGLAGIKNPSKEDIASAIAGEAQNQGYDRNTAIGIISAAMQESGIDPNVTNASGHHGLFQESSDKPSQGAAQQIKWMFDQLNSLGGPSNPALKSDPLDLIATQIEKGGYGGAALGQHAGAAASLYDKVLQNAATAGVGSYAIPGLGALSSNPASAASHLPKADNVEDSINAAGGLPSLYPTSGPGAYQLPPWMQQLASAFGLTASTYSSGGSLHQMGFAADFNDPNAGPGQGSSKLDALAQYLESNLSGQTLQLIHQGMNGQAYAVAGGQQVGPGTSQPGYYGGDLSGHQDHVHWATDVAPILANANAGALPAAAGNLPVQQSGYGSQNPIGVGQNNQALAGTTGGAKVSPASAGLGNAQTDASGKPLQAGFAQVQTAGQQNAVSSASQASQVFNTVAGAVSGAANVASDVVSTIQAGVDAWGATKYIADQMVRGISDTEDVYNLVDQVQKYITFASKIASTTGDVLSTVGSLIPDTGGADMGGAEGAKEGLQIASQIAQMISAALTTVNAVIDFGQEAYRVWGSYFGQFLGFLTGGAGGMMGDVHFLLDQNTGQLEAYSSDNPLNKTAHTLPGQIPNPNANNQLIGQLNYYAGPGEDPQSRYAKYDVSSTSKYTKHGHGTVRNDMVKDNWGPTDDFANTDENAIAAAVNSLLNLDRVPNSLQSLPRSITSNNIGAPNSGDLLLSYCSAPSAFSATAVNTYCADIAASGLTKCRFGIYTVAENGNLTLAASTANDTTLFGSAFNGVTKSLSSSYAIVESSIYAVGLLLIGTTIPSIGGTYVNQAETSVAPRLNGIVAGQTDLPSSIATGSVAGDYRIAYFRVA